jgi:hypothetical protein
VKNQEKKLNLKPFIAIALTIGFTLAFLDKILTIYGKIIVNPILSHYKSNKPTELIIIILCIVFLVKAISKVHKSYNGLLSNSVLFGGSSLVIIYWLVRLTTTKYNFYTFANIEGFYVSDLFFISLSFIIIYSFIVSIVLFLRTGNKSKVEKQN